MKISSKRTLTMRVRENGFSLIEMMIVVVVMLICSAVVFRAADQFQQRGMTEAEKVDSVQSARDFMDTVNRDIHDAGYPPLEISANGSTTCANNAGLSCGIVYYSPLQIQYEGDLDGTGTVYRVTLQVQPGANGSCPCILRRGVVTKTDALAGTVPTYYTEVNGLLNSGNWAGGATYGISLSGTGNYAAYGPIDVFDGYDNSGNLVTTTCTTAAACIASATPVRDLQITANIAPNFADPQTHQFPVFSISSKARLSNVNK